MSNKKESEDLSYYLALREDLLKREDAREVIISVDKKIAQLEDREKIWHINQFQNGWKPLNTLVYNTSERTEVWVWCEFPSGSEPRRCSMHHVDGTYIYCNVKFKEVTDTDNGVFQGAVAWRGDGYSSATPYKNEEHRKLWREYVEISDTRRVYYMKR